MPALIEDAKALYDAAVRSVQADRLLEAQGMPAWLDQPDAYRRVVVVGAGKAAMAMAGAVEARLGRRIDAGMVVVPHGYRATLPQTQRAPDVVEVVEAGHPVPDTAGAEAAARVHALAAACGPGDLLLVLISGGGSALWPAPASGLSLADVQATTGLLLRSGADIHQINTVRKHLSSLKGGRLAAAASPATVRALVVSDVVGDDLAVIASAPTMPDPSTYAQAVAVLDRFALWRDVSTPVRNHLERGVQGALPETPKPGAACFARAQTMLIGSNREALEAARQAAEQRGYTARIVAHTLVGEARAVGKAVVQGVLEADDRRPVCLLWGGETTVTVTGTGRGGRNQEVALAAALALEGSPRRVAVLSGGTDGIDGPTDAAGAWATPHTAPTARALGLNPAAFLANNDAYTFFEQAGGLLRTGPTHTNVMDVLIALSAS